MELIIRLKTAIAEAVQRYLFGMTKSDILAISAAAGGLKERIDALDRTFDLYWKADQRAIKRWQAAGAGRKNTWPDRANMVVWLLNERDRDHAALAKLRAALREQHEWHNGRGTIGLQNGNEWIEIDDSLEYADSPMCSRTVEALAVAKEETNVDLIETDPPLLDHIAICEAWCRLDI